MELKCRAIFGVLLYCNNGMGKNYRLNATNYVSNYIINNKKKKMMEIIRNIFYGIDIINADLIFKKGVGYILLDFIVSKTRHNRTKYHMFADAEQMTDVREMVGGIKKSLIEMYGEWTKRKYIGDAGPDTWMSGMITILDNEIDGNLYEIVPSFYKLQVIEQKEGFVKKIKVSRKEKIITKHGTTGKSKSKRHRKGPTDSARLFEIGTKKKRN